jgi:DNA-binding PadR family transcriptional regulator
MPDNNLSEAQQHLPLPHLTFLLLVAVARTPRYGYEIGQEVERESDGCVHPSIGSLYLALQRLQRQELLREVDPPPGETPSGRRRYYLATEMGRKVAGLEAGRLERLAQLARSRDLILEATS